MAGRADGSLLFDTKIDKTGFTDGLSRLKRIAKTSAAAIGAAMAAGLTASVRAGMDFESAFAGVKKTVDATTEQLAGLRREILDMSGSMPMAASDIAGIAEAAGQLGIKTDNIRDFTKVMADLSVATNMTSEQAATELARFANITQMPQDRFDRLGATIVDLGNNLATTESEIVSMGLRLAGAGHQVGMTEAQIMSFAGGLSSVGIEAEAGGSALSRLMADMQLATATGGEDLNGFAAVAGMSAQAFKKAFEEDAAGAIIAFIQGLAKSQEKGTTAIEVLDSLGIKEIRLRDALLRAAGASGVFTEAMEIGSRAWEENTALTKEAEQRYETVESKLQIMKNSLTNLGIAVYDKLREPFKNSIDVAIKKIEGLSSSLKSGKLEGALEGVSKLFSGVVNGAINIAGKAIPALVKLTAFAGKHAKAITAAAVAVGGYKAALQGLAMANQVITWGKGLRTTIQSIIDVKKLGIGYSTLYKAACMGEAGATKACSVAGLADIATKGGQVTATKAATGATLVFNKALLANPAVLAVGAVVALTAAIAALAIMNYKASAAEQARKAQLEELTSTTERLTDAAKQQNDAYTSAISNINTSASAELAELARLEEMADELVGLADANGNVEEANRGRAAYILGEFNEAMGTEYTLVDGQIQKYGELKSSIYDTIDAMQAKIVLSAYEDMLTEAVKRQAEAQQNAADASDAILTAQKEKSAVVDEYVSKFNEMTDFTITAAEAEKRLADGTAFSSLQLGGIIKRYNEYEDVIAENTKRIEESGAAAAEVADLRQKVSDMTMQVEQKNYQAVLDSFQMSEDTKKAIASGSRDEMLNQLRATYDEIEALEKLRDSATTENEKAGWQERINAMVENGAQLVGAIQQTGVDAVEGLAQAFRNDGVAPEEAAAWAQRIIARVKAELDEHSPSRVMRYDVGGNAVKGLVLSFQDGEKDVYTAAERLARQGVNGYNAGQKAHSPAKEYIKASQNSIDGLIKGIDDNADRLTDRMEKLADDELNTAMAANDALLDSERTYLSESRRMEREKDEAEYKEKLAAAKTSKEAQKIKNERKQKLQEEADKRYLEQLKETAEAERKLVEQQKDDLIKLFEDATDEAMSLMDDLADKQETFQKKLLDNRKLFYKKTITFKGAGERGEDLQFTETHLGDLDAQLAAMQSYADILMKVHDRGKLPKGFFDELRAMSIEDGTAFAEALLAADDETFAAYLKSWEAIRNTSEDISKNVFGDEFSELERKLTEQFGKLPEDFFNIGEDSAAQFGSGFMGKLDKLLAEAREKIQTGLAMMAPVLSVEGGYAGGGAAQNNVNTTVTYNLTAAGSTVSEQLHAIRAAEQINKLRG